VLDAVARGTTSDDGLAGPVSASRAPDDLGEELKRPFGRSKIRQPQTHVRRHDADERDAGKVVPFGDHLGPDEDVDFAGGEPA
jgi:hypothetical protein